MKKLENLSALLLPIQVTDPHALWAAILRDLLGEPALLMQCLDFIAATEGAATNKDIRDCSALGGVGKESLDSQAVGDNVQFDDVWGWLDLVQFEKIVLGFLRVWAV